MTTHPSRFPSGSPNAALDAFKAACAREWPPDAFALVNQTLADLRFTLPDQEGRLVDSQELLAGGPLVPVFYRGMW